MNEQDIESKYYHCINCSDPYQLTEEWEDSNLCCEECEKSYTEYLKDPDNW